MTLRSVRGWFAGLALVLAGAVMFPLGGPGNAAAPEPAPVVMPLVSPLAPGAQPLSAVEAASLKEMIFDVVKFVVPADVITMTRFTIAHPGDAATVFYHAASQDYPFFGLVAAAKAMKNKKIPGLGVFTYERCVFPVTVVDQVFAKADGMVDDTAGKQQTSGITAQAKQYATDAIKQGTQEAKEQANQYLMENVPYYGEIDTICTFAFETDFQDERNFQAAISKTVYDIKKAYEAFSSGSYVTGVQTLITLGVSKEAACGFLDTALDTALIGKIPGVGAVVSGVCAGFLGKVLDGIHGIVKGGYEGLKWTGEALYDGAKWVGCKLYSLVGGGCSGGPPPPPNFANQVKNWATQWCAPHGGLAALNVASETDGNAKFAFNCGDTSKCQRREGMPPSCVTAQEQAAYDEALRKQIDGDVASALPAWKARALSSWQPKCPSDTPNCVAAVKLFIETGEKQVAVQHQANPLIPYAQIAATPIAQAEDKAAKAVEQWRFAVLPDRWRDGFQAYWGNGKCPDAQCVSAIKIIAVGGALRLKQIHDANPAMSWDKVAAQVLPGADGEAAQAVAAADARVVALNKSITKDASEGWEQLLIGIWTPKCADAICVDEVKQLAGKAKIAMRLLQLGKPDASSLSIAGDVLKEYRPKFEAAVAGGNIRKLRQIGMGGVRPVTPTGPVSVPGGIGKPGGFVPLPPPTPRPSPRP